MTNVNLSDGEWKIMNVLWERESATITELTAILQGETGWDKHIIITMLNRMLKKGAVSLRVADKALTKEDIAELYEILEQAEKAEKEGKKGSSS